MKDSVDNAPFVQRMLSDQSIPTPIGVNNLTNDSDLKVQDLEPIEGAVETFFSMDMFDTHGDDGTFTYTRSKRVDFKNKVRKKPRIVDVKFDNASGILKIIQDDSNVIEADNIPTQDDLGVGPRGERGPRGKDGKNGRNGGDGRKGATGCAGPVGPTGPTGPPGPDGKDGDRGETGSGGCEGTSGRQGPMGPAGRIGDDGPTGPMNPSCFAEQGPQGPAGRDALNNVYIGSSSPTENYFAWAQPG